MDAKEIGERIAFLRTEREMSRNRLATKAGVSPTYIYQIECGEKCPTVEYLDYICFGLGITLADFFNHEKKENDFDDEELLRKIKEMKLTEKQALLTLLNRK